LELKTFIRVQEAAIRVQEEFVCMFIRKGPTNGVQINY